jgi:hypothetical protein
MDVTIEHDGRKLKTTSEAIQKMASTLRKNRELPGMPDAGPLRNAAEDFIEQREAIEDEKAKLEFMAQDILEAMKKEGRYEFALAVNGERYKFSIKEASLKLKLEKVKGKIV